MEHTRGAKLQEPHFRPDNTDARSLWRKISCSRESGQIRLLVADSRAPAERDSYSRLARDGDIELCGIATTLCDALEQAAELKPMVTVAYVRGANDSELSMLRHLRRVPEPPALVVVTSCAAERAVIEDLLALGVHGLLHESEAIEFLSAAVRCAAEQRRLLTPRITNVLLPRYTTPSARDAHKLRPRDRLIIQLIAEGRANKHIADALRISPRTAELHRAAMMHRCQLRSIAEVVRYAVRSGIVEA